MISRIISIGTYRGADRDSSSRGRGKGLGSGCKPGRPPSDLAELLIAITFNLYELELARLPRHSLSIPTRLWHI